MKVSNSVRSYFLQLVAAVILGAIAFWSVNLYLVGNYRYISQHFIDDDVVFLETISHYSLEMTEVHSELLTLLGQSEYDVGVFYDQAITQLDRVREVVNSIEKSDGGGTLHGHSDVGSIDSKPLVIPLKEYLHGMIDAVELKLLGSPQVSEFINIGQEKYFKYHVLASKLIVAVGDEVEMEQIGRAHV